MITNQDMLTNNGDVDAMGSQSFDRETLFGRLHLANIPVLRNLSTLTHA